MNHICNKCDKVIAERDPPARCRESITEVSGVLFTRREAPQALRHIEAETVSVDWRLCGGSYKELF